MRAHCIIAIEQVGGCRGAQALTEVTELVPTVFFGDFEAEPR